MLGTCACVHPLYQMYGTKIYCAKTRKKAIGNQWLNFCLVAGMGFEPHDLQVMSLASYRTALPRVRNVNEIIPHLLLPVKGVPQTFLKVSIKKIDKSLKK